MVVDPPDDGMRSTTFPQGNAWHCIQWNFQNSTFSAKLDGALLDKAPVVNHWTNGTGWTNLIVGFQLFLPANPNPASVSPANYWLDDLAFGEQEIPCPGP
jgi:hypothetical protein